MANKPLIFINKQGNFGYEKEVLFSFFDSGQFSDLADELFYFFVILANTKLFHVLQGMFRDCSSFDDKWAVIE